MPPRSPAKMMWTTCFRTNLRSGEIESTIATGPSTGSSSLGSPISSSSSRWSASTRLSPEFTPPPGSSQYSRLARLLVPDQEHARRASAGSPTRGSAARRPSAPDEPVAALAALALGSSSTSRGSTAGRRDDELRDPHPGSTTNGLLAVRVQQDDRQLAPVAGVDEPGRVHDRDPVARGEAERGWTKPACPRGSRPRARCRRRPARPARADALAGGEIEAGVAVVGARGHDGVRTSRRTGSSITRRSAAARAAASRRRGTARTGASSAAAGGRG